MKTKRFPFIWIAALSLFPGACLEAGEISGELKTWHRITIHFDGPPVAENDATNPFLNFRLNVRFIHEDTGRSYLVPGHFAADGNAAETGAGSGSVWRVYFSPDRTGTWRYEVDFRRGAFSAVSSKWNTGESAGYMDGESGKFEVASSDKTGRDFRAHGRLEYVGGHYLRFAGSGDYFLKVGTDAPENLLSYADFDGTFHDDGHKDNLVKAWEAHRQDWREGDPSWQGGKGKGLIGALNYLASEGLNAVSFLTCNIEGDDQNVFPYTHYDTLERFDVSKLDQWEIVFSHAQRLGLFLHFKTLEAENQGLHDGGGLGVQRKLYYRELISRFGHHLALNWNMCEENGEWVVNHETPPQDTWQRLGMARYFRENDPYQHHRVIHNGRQFDDLLGPDSDYTGPSVQTNMPDFRNVHRAVIRWRDNSRAAGKPWAVAVDEPGDAQHALVPDKDDPDHDDARINGLWGALLGGAWGIEWYFGYKHEHSDLTCEDFRSRDLFWDQCRIALQFFEYQGIPFWNMSNMDDLLSNPRDFCFGQRGEIYVVFLRNGGEAQLDLLTSGDAFSVEWYDPRNGGELQSGSIRSITGMGQEGRANNSHSLGLPPSATDRDWVALVRRLPAAPLLN